MNTIHISRLTRSMSLAALSLITASALASVDLSGLKVSGSLDIYYQYDFGRPATGNSVNFRQFDIAHNSLSLANAEVDITKDATPGKVGFTANLVTGKNTEVLNSTEPGGAQAYRNVQQLYTTLLLKNGATVDVGKFLTYIGGEGVLADRCMNYSRSFLFTLAEPVYHMGVRYTQAVPKVGTVTLVAVNGWNEVEDSNGNKSFGASLGLTPSSKTSLTVNYYGGVEGSGGTNGIGLPAKYALDLADVVFTYQANSKLALMLNGDYATAKINPASMDVASPAIPAVSGTWYGLQGCGQYTLNSSTKCALRYESVSDPRGLRTGTATELHSLTGTLDFNIAENATLRFEVRQDTSSKPLFTSHSGAKKSRTTFTLAQCFRF